MSISGQTTQDSTTPIERTMRVALYLRLRGRSADGLYRLRETMAHKPNASACSDLHAVLCCLGLNARTANDWISAAVDAPVAPPTAPIALVAHGLDLVWRGEPLATAAVFRDAASDPAVTALATLGQGLAAAALGEPEHAIDLITEAMAQDPALDAIGWVHAQRLRLQTTIGNAAGAQKFLTLGRASAGDGIALVEAAWLDHLVRHRQLDEAINHARTLAGAASNAAQMRVALAALVRLGQADELTLHWSAAGGRLGQAQRQAMDDDVVTLLARAGHVEDAVALLKSRLVQAEAQPSSNTAGDCRPSLLARLATLALTHELPGLAPQDLLADAAELAQGQGRDLPLPVLLAQAQWQANTGDAAGVARTLHRAVALHPGQPGTELAWGAHMMEQGQLHGGLARMRSAWCLASHNPHLLQVPRCHLPGDSASLSRLEVVLAQPDLPTELLTSLLQDAAAAGLSDGDGLRAVTLAERASNTLRPALGHCARRARRQVEDILAYFTRERLHDWSGWGLQTDVPVLLAGLLHAGQAEAGQLLNTHPQLHVAGRLAQLPQQLARLQRQDMDLGLHHPYPDCMDELDSDDVHAIASRQLDALRAWAPAASRIVVAVDAAHIGFIKLLFPAARVLWCRDAAAALAVRGLLSGDQGQDGRTAAVHDLHSFGQAVVDHERLMHHWHRLYGADVLAIDRAQLLAEPAACTRKLLAHVHLSSAPGLTDSANLDAASAYATVSPSACGASSHKDTLGRVEELQLTPQQSATLSQAMAVQPVQPLPRPAAALPPQHLRHALRRLAAGDLAGAESRLRGQLDVDPHLAVAWRALGEVQRRRRQPLAAWQSIRQALQVQPAELGHWRALTDAQHELLAAGLDLAAVALAQRQLNAAKTLLEDLALLAAATAPQTRSDTTARSEQAATAAIAEALSAAGLPACPVSASLARLQGRRRSTAAHPLMLQVPAAQLEDAATALQKLGLTRTPGSADAALVLRWPAHPVSVVLLPGPADPAATWTQVGPLGFLVSPAQLVACQESDGAPAASLWQTHDQLRQWTDGRLTNWTPIRRPRSTALWHEPSSDLFGRIGDHMQQAMSALNDIGRHLACQGDGIQRLSRADDEVRSLVGRIP